MANMLPMVVTLLVAGSGPNSRPSGRSCSLSRSWTTPGCTRTRSASMRITRRRWAEKSRTSPGPSDSPATPVPAPRAWMGRRFSAAYCTQAATSAVERGRTTAQRLDLVDARVAGEKLKKDVVAAHLAGDQPAEIVLDAFALLVEWMPFHRSVSGISGALTSENRKMVPTCSSYTRWSSPRQSKGDTVRRQTRPSSPWEPQA